MRPYYEDESVTLLHGDAATQLEALPTASVDCVVTSPPYWGLRDYGVAGQLGMENSHQEYVAALTAVFDQVARVLRKNGTAWLNIGDRYSSNSDGYARGDNHNTRQTSIRPAAPDITKKSLIGLPWRVAFALHDRGWVIRQEIIWHKPKPVPDRGTGRFTSAHETVFLLTRHREYHFTDIEAQLGRGDVWTLPHGGEGHGHEAPYPQALPWRCIAAGCPVGGTVLDPFSGTGTTGEAARKLGRRYIGVDLNSNYLDMQVARFAQGVLFGGAA